MDQTIRRILELDAATEERLAASRLLCSEKIEQARKQAAAIEQAMSVQTRDTVTEIEEQERIACEEKTAKVRGDFDQRTEAMTKRFSAQHDALLDALFADTLQDAEA